MAVVVMVNMSALQQCTSYFPSVKYIPVNISINGETNATVSHRQVTSQPVFGWFEFLVSTICLLGIVGNMLNLLVLTRRRLLSGMDRLEKSANYGLVALAFSDLMFCLMVFPHTFIHSNSRTADAAHAYELYYRLYGISTINLFLMISTWLIVCMAVNRFIVVVYPFKARQVLGARYTITSIVSVYIFSLAWTLPFFIRMKVQACLAEDGSTRYTFAPRWGTKSADSMKLFMMWVWPIMADFIPVLILATCNSRLIRELRAAESARRRIGSASPRSRDSSHKVTLTLVVIVLLLLFLASPAEILRYINPYHSLGSLGPVLVSITNIMQLSNFAFNFVLYCLVNAGFRNEAKSMFRCFPKRKTDFRSMYTVASTTDCTAV